jgi:serine O-acetyltransferase
MTFKQFKKLVSEDIKRFPHHTGWLSKFRIYRRQGGFRILFWTRLVQMIETKALLRYTVFPVLVSHQRHLRRLFSIEFPLRLKVGGGLYMPHQVGIVINPKAVIGSGVYIAQGVTIGKSMKEENEGAPVIGDNVFIGPNAVILGPVTLGSNCAVGANAVVLKDVAANETVGGVPARPLVRMT